jgi:hypothetical protein
MTGGGEPTPELLDYAPPVRWWRRRRVAATLLVSLLLVCGASVAWRWGPWARDRITFLLAQQRCMNYAAPPNRVVITTHVEEVETLASSDLPYRRLRRPASVNQGFDVMPYSWHTAEAWQNFPAGKWEPGPAFLHARRTPGGERRLIALELSVGGDDLLIYCRNFKPASLRDNGDLSRGPRTIRGIYRIFGLNEPIRVFAGQPDPNDASRFTIRCESGKQSAIIRGQVHDDGRVAMEVSDTWLLDRWAEGLRPGGTFHAAPTTLPSRRSTRSLFTDSPPPRL